MAGSISLSLSQQFDELGRPLSNGRLYTYAAGTTTPQNAYQDSGLTIPWPNYLTLDSAGRIPQLFFADGFIKIRLQDQFGVTQITADNVMVVGPSSGGGGGSSVDPTTILQTGDVKPRYAIGVHAGFVRCNGRTIGSATSGATERANADTQALFIHLYTQDPYLVVSGGRGVSAAADFAANKTIALPDARSRAVAGLGDMGNTDNGLLAGTSFTFGTATILGSIVGAARRALGLSNIPPIVSTNASQPINVVSGSTVPKDGTIDSINSPATGTPVLYARGTGATQGTLSSAGNNNISVASQGTLGLLFDALSPYWLLTLYIKL